MTRSFTICDAPQRSEAWFQARLGRLTGSVAGDIIATIAKGEAAGRRNLRLRLVLERLTGKSMEQGFQSQAMLTGIEREPLAFAAFEALTGQFAERTGFLSHTDYMAGCSLDGHVGDFETLFSIKCRQPAAHLLCVRSGAIPADALAQMRHELWITGAERHVYFSWNPDFPPALQAKIIEVSRDVAKIPEYESAALAFLNEVDHELHAITEML